MKLLRVWFVVFACLAVAVLPACGGGGDDDDDDGGSEDESRDPTRTPRATRTPTPTPEFVPTFAEGGWTGGQAKATVSGGATATVEGTLLVRSSSTSGKPEYQTTGLTFTQGLDTILLSISTQYQPFAMAVRKNPTVYVNQGTCEVTYSATDEKRIEGTFKCTDVDVEQGATSEAPTTVEGTFFATR